MTRDSAAKERRAARMAEAMSRAIGRPVPWAPARDLREEARRLLAMSADR